MKRSSHSRVRRSVTPLRSGPTLIPFPKVWQAVQRLRKMVFASSAAFAGIARAAEARIRTAAGPGHAMRIRRAAPAEVRVWLWVVKLVICCMLVLSWSLCSITGRSLSDESHFRRAENWQSRLHLLPAQATESIVTCLVSHKQARFYKTYFSIYRRSISPWQEHEKHMR